MGYSKRDKRAGPAGWRSKATGEAFEPTRLLYPVTHKNYTDDEFISHEWKRLAWWLKQAARVTIFGYSAPTTDVEACCGFGSALGVRVLTTGPISGESNA